MSGVAVLPSISRSLATLSLTKTMREGMYFVMAIEMLSFLIPVDTVLSMLHKGLCNEVAIAHTHRYDVADECYAVNSYPGTDFSTMLCS